jgi:hypothetical protein
MADGELANPRRLKVSVLLTKGELDRLERYCVQRGYKKSTLIARLIRDHLDAEQFRVQGELPLNHQPP